MSKSVEEAAADFQAATDAHRVAVDRKYKAWVIERLNKRVRAERNALESASQGNPEHPLAKLMLREVALLFEAGDANEPEQDALLLKHGAAGSALDEAVAEFVKS